MNFQEETGMQVISGGQTGVDLAGIRAAKSLGFRTGGEAPRGWKTTNGSKPTLSWFGLTEGKGGYHDRTVNNVVMSDATLILALLPNSPGTALTIKTCERFNKPYRIVDLNLITNDVTQSVVEWIKTNAGVSTALTGGFILNVAGNSSKTAPGVFVPAFTFMLNMLMLIDNDQSESWAEKKDMFLMLLQPDIIRQLHDNFQPIPQLDPRHHVTQTDGEIISTVIDDDQESR